MMKKLMSYTILALFATIAVSIAAPDKDTMMAKEKAAWQAFKDKKADETPFGKRDVCVCRRRLRHAGGIGGHAKVGHEIVCDQ
jgi:hypothetical protein